MSDSQIQNFRLAIRKKKAKIEEITLICSHPPRPGVTAGSRRRLIEKRLHLEQAVAELEKEVKRLEFFQADRNFRWDDINQHLLSAKTQRIAEVMNRRISEGKRTIEFEVAQLGNNAAFPGRWFDFMEQIADERARMIYEAHRETWTQQNRVITPSFIRAVRDRVLVQVFAAMKSSVSDDILLRGQRLSKPVNSGVLSGCARRIDRLVTRWNRDLEADAIAAQYGGGNHRKPNALSSSQPVSDNSEEMEAVNASAEYAVNHHISGVTAQNGKNRPADSGAPRREATMTANPGFLPSFPKYQTIPSTWDVFYQSFKALSDEEVEVALRKTSGESLLRAYVDYQDPNSKYGDFQFGGGITETFKARFVVLAMSAARNLSANNLDGPPLNAWLYHVFQDLVQHKSDLLFAPSETGAIITRICEASALYCLRLQAKALEEDQSAKEEQVDNKRTHLDRSASPAPQAAVPPTPSLPRRLERGKDCEELAEEIRTIRHKRIRSGMTMNEIQTECSSFSVWKRVEILSTEDRDTFMRPGTWETGYENLFLGKLYAKAHRAVSPASVNTWRKDYRAYLKWRATNSKTPADRFIRELAARRRSYRKKPSNS